jgi:hypothetical protein
MTGTDLICAAAGAVNSGAASVRAAIAQKAFILG